MATNQGRQVEEPDGNQRQSTVITKADRLKSPQKMAKIWPWSAPLDHSSTAEARLEATREPSDGRRRSGLQHMPRWRAGGARRLEG